MQQSQIEREKIIRSRGKECLRLDAGHKRGASNELVSSIANRRNRAGDRRGNRKSLSGLGVIGGVKELPSLPLSFSVVGHDFLKPPFIFLRRLPSWGRRRGFPMNLFVRRTVCVPWMAHGENQEVT